MITQPDVWRRAERELKKRESLTPKQGRALFDALYQEARRLGVLPSRNRLEGLEKDLALASVLNRPARE